MDKIAAYCVTFIVAFNSDYFIAYNYQKCPHSFILYLGKMAIYLKIKTVEQVFFRGTTDVE